MEIIKESNGKPSYLSIYHIALNLVGYISMYNGLILLGKDIGDNKDYNRFMEFANNSLLKDMAIELNELYKFSADLLPNIWDSEKMKNPDFIQLQNFINKLRNNMKLSPKRTIIDGILEKSKNRFPTNFLGLYRNDILYYCGYYHGENIIFGSNLYYDYIFYKPRKYCLKENDLYRFTNSISEHLVSFYRVFEKEVFNNSIDIPTIKLKPRKKYFQFYNRTTRFDKMLLKSKYDKRTIFVFMLIIEEISGIEIYTNYMFDLEESIKDPLLLYFFTQFIAIKYDEIRDAIDELIKNGEKFEVNYIMLEDDISKLNIFKKETTDFAYKLRNFHHFSEVEKYKMIYSENESGIQLDFKDLYLMVTDTKNWSEDFRSKLYDMKNDLNMLYHFCQKNVGINY